MLIVGQLFAMQIGFDSQLILFKNFDPILVQYIKQVLQIADLAIWCHCVDWTKHKIIHIVRTQTVDAID